MDAAELSLLTDTLRKTMTAPPGAGLYPALCELGWHDLLTGAETADIAVPLVFRLLGETGAHAPLINDVIAHAAGRPFGETPVLPYAGGSRVRWDTAADSARGALLDPELPLVRITGSAETPDAAADLPTAPARRALGWWLTGSSRAMLGLARTHALERHQFGRPVAGFQAIRHRLAEALVAIEGAEAALALTPGDARHPAHPDIQRSNPEESDALGALLAKAAAGRAALLTARHCQQVLGGIGFTAEHEFHRHYKRVLVLDGLLGSTRELTREAGATLRNLGYAPRLAHL